MGGIIHTCYNIYVSENRGGNVAHLVELWTSTVLTQVQFLSVAKDCFPRAAFQCRLSFSVYTSPCAVACINIFTHIRASLVNVRVQSIMETIKKTPSMHQKVERLCRSWLSLWKPTQISPWEKSQWGNTVVKKKESL